MISLNKFLPQISGFLNTTPAALYERQRQLVRLGILRAEKGRGPGSGVKLSADGVAALLVALLVTDNLSDTNDQIRLFLDSRPLVKSAKIGAKTFGEVLAEFLLSPQKLPDLEFIEVHRSIRLAQIWFMRGKKYSHTIFATPRARDFILPGGIDVKASVGKNTLFSISLALTAALGNQEENAHDQTLTRRRRYRSARREQLQAPIPGRRQAV
jgi:hypothetical protein